MRHYNLQTMNLKQSFFLILGCISLFLFSFTLKTPIALTVKTGYVNNEVGLKVLDQPNENALLIDILDYGTLVEKVTNLRNDFVKITINGKEGYVKDEFLQKEKPESTTLSEIFSSKNLFTEDGYNSNFNPYMPDDREKNCDDEYFEGEWSWTLQGDFIQEAFWSGCCCINTLGTRSDLQAQIGKTITIDNDKIEIEENSIRLSRHLANFRNYQRNQGWVLANSLNVKSQPSLESKTVAALSKNTKIQIIKSNEETQIINGIKGKFIKVKSGKLVGYVFDAYISPIPLPEMIEDASYKNEENYVALLDKAGFKVLEYTYGCSNGDCDELATGYPISKPYQAFRIAQMLEPNSRLKNATIRFDEKENAYLVNFQPVKTNDECPVLNEKISNQKLERLLININCGGERLYLELNEGFMFFRLSFY